MTVGIHVKTDRGDIHVLVKTDRGDIHVKTDRDDDGMASPLRTRLVIANQDACLKGGEGESVIYNMYILCVYIYKI